MKERRIDRGSARSVQPLAVMTEQAMNDTSTIDGGKVSMSDKRARRRAAAMLRLASRYARKPMVGATVAGTAVLAAGALFGVTEAVLAGAFAWAVFRTLRRGATKTEKPQESGTAPRQPTHAAAE